MKPEHGFGIRLECWSPPFVARFYFLVSENRVLDVNSAFKIKNPNFKAGLKNMTKLVHDGTWWQWSSL